MTERQSRHFAKNDEGFARLHRFLIDAQDERLSGNYAVQSGLTAHDANEQIEHAVAFIEIARRKMS